MSWEVHSSYFEFRTRVLEPVVLHETDNDPPSERLLQALWAHQRLRRVPLTTTDGRNVEILHPGFWNREAGPDFKDAIVRWEGESATRGDIEIDLRSSGWRSHRHRENPHYNRVILHVVWNAETAPVLPTLILSDHLDAPMDELIRWHSHPTWNALASSTLGKCRMPLQSLSDAAQASLIHDAAKARLQARAHRMLRSARWQGWVGALWAFVFRALGYKQNAWPMQWIGERAARLLQGVDSVERMQARLLGVAGLLPGQWSRGDEEAKLLWERYRSMWDEDAPQLRLAPLPSSVWQLANIRPANHPQRRLALAAHWLAGLRWVADIEQWSRDTDLQGRRMIAALREILCPKSDPFWSRHWTLRSLPAPEDRALLGRARMSDVVINAILPWLWARAMEANDRTTLSRIEDCYFTWPSAQDNGVLRLARQRLLQGEASRRLLKTAAAQQGLLQIVSDFCEHSDALCADCPFPAQVEQLQSHQPDASP